MPTVEELETKLAALEAKMSSTPLRREKEPQKEEPKPEPQFTWAQLKQAASNGEISEDQAMELWSQQQRATAVAEATEKVAAETRTRDVQKAVNAEIDVFKEAVPDCMVPGTEARQRVEREFRRLVAIGFDDSDVRTELAALQAAFGSSAQLKDRPKKAKKEPEKTAETHGSDGDDGSNDEGDAPDRAPSDLDPEVKRYYRQQIERGLYSGWKEVREELKFARTARKRRR